MNSILMIQVTVMDMLCVIDDKANKGLWTHTYQVGKVNKREMTKLIKAYYLHTCWVGKVQKPSLHLSKEESFLSHDFPFHKAIS